MISTELSSALKELASTPSLLIAMDFDGTLAPFVTQPEDARALPEAAQALRDLAALPPSATFRTTTALISGRSLDSLRAAAQPPAETLLVASHGAESYLGPGPPSLRLTEVQQEALIKATSLVSQISQRCPGSLVEQKPAGVVLHTRTCSPHEAKTAESRALAELGSLPVHILSGKHVLEISLIRTDKGEGLGLLQQHCQATGTLFAGDDRTDENGFAALCEADIGVKVGPGDTCANYRIGSVDDTAALLKEILAFRRTVLGI